MMANGFVAFKPSPDFGVFDHAYFEMMIRGRL